MGKLEMCAAWLRASNPDFMHSRRVFSNHLEYMVVALLNISHLENGRSIITPEFYSNLFNTRIHKHLKKSNAACFYMQILLKLLIIIQMCKKHKEGNFITINLTPHLLQLVKY